MQLMTTKQGWQLLHKESCIYNTMKVMLASAQIIDKTHKSPKPKGIDYWLAFLYLRCDNPTLNNQAQYTFIDTCIA